MCGNWVTGLRRRRKKKRCRTAAADVMLQKFDGLIAAGDFLASERYKNTAEARAKIAMAKEMKTYYEKRMKMMQSPYYVLLGVKDLKAYMGNDWEEKLQREVKDEGFKEYVRLYREVKESAYGKKGNLQAIYDRLVSDIRITLKDRDLESFNKIYGDPERYKDKDPETIFRNVRDSLAQEKKNEYPPDNIEFLEKIEPVQGGTIRPGALDIEDIRSMEKILLEIAKNKTVEGTALKPEEVGEYGKEIDHIIGLRRNYISMRPGVEKVLEIREGGNIEAKNPEFAKTEQGRIVQMMTNEDSYDIAETLLSEVNRQGVEYVNALQSIMNNLMDSGYSISRKYEQRLTDSEDKTVEEMRKAYQDKINKKNEPRPRHLFSGPRADSKTVCTSHRTSSSSQSTASFAHIPHRQLKG